MNCPRCNYGLILVSEKKSKTKIDKAPMLTKDYYCLRCKSGLSEIFKDGDIFHSEWIDFNG
jgi:DNA-directed RNA polymerase subunit RPC12/RpoP